METVDYINLSWSSHSTNFKTVLKDLHQGDSLSDVTLVCDDGIETMAHKFVLIGSSPVFRSMLYRSSHRDKTIVYLRGVSKIELEWVLQFMYFGQAQVPSTKLQLFMELAKDLKMKGLYDEDDIKSQGNTEEQVVDETESLLIHLDNSTTGKEKDIRSFEKDTTTHDEEDSTVDSHDEKFESQQKVFDRIQEEIQVSNFKCRECDYSSEFFLNPEKLLSHHIEKEHEGVRYPCDLCDHQGHSLNSLRDHQATMHKINPKFRCKLCDYCTNHSTSKRLHVERKHPASIGQDIFEISKQKGRYSKKNNGDKTKSFGGQY